MFFINSRSHVTLCCHLVLVISYRLLVNWINPGHRMFWLPKRKPPLKVLMGKNLLNPKVTKVVCGYFWNSAVDVHVSLSTVCIHFPLRYSLPIWCSFLPSICWLGFNFYAIMLADLLSSYMVNCAERLLTEWAFIYLIRLSAHLDAKPRCSFYY